MSAVGPAQRDATVAPMVSFHPSRRLLLFLVPAIAAFLIALVVGDSSAGAKATLNLKAVEKGGLKFSKKTLHASGGKVTIVMRNPKGNHFPHAIAVEGKGLEKKGKVVTAGGVSRVTLTLKKGRTYEFYCPVGKHKQAGMNGKITVG
jgi:plastocyanin